MNIAVLGAGKVGTALAVAWGRAGHRNVAVSGRTPATTERTARLLPGVPVMSPPDAASDAELLLIATPDHLIAEIVHELALSGLDLDGRIVCHVSGSSGLGVLEEAEWRGARPLAIHPLQSFPTAEAGIERLPGSGMAVTAKDEETIAVGERLAKDARCIPFRVADDARPLYHAAAVFAANYLATTMILADRLFRAAEIEDPVPLFAPLSRAVLENVVAMGPAAALTGPAARGDAGTIERNLYAIATTDAGAVGPYVALARAALDVAEREGSLSPDQRRTVEEVLARWT
jgi:predicted short-subunit dehydrogenase-like oxidoreductase (DUF2520 family)